MWYFTCINATLHVKKLLLTVSCEVLTASCEVFTMNFERETELVDVSNNSFDFSKFRLHTSVNYVVLHMH